MLAVALLLIQVSAATPPTAVARPPDVVVTGKRLQQALDACRRGECTVLRDAQVSIASAEQLFRDGRYPDAQKLLTQAIARNRDKAATDPKPVAALYEASATVAVHHGDLERYRRSTGHQARTLRENLPATDPAVAAGEFAVVDMWIQLGKLFQADESLSAMARRARDAGQSRLAALATLRRAAIPLGGDARGRTADLLAQVAGLSDDADIARAAQIVQLRVWARGADDAKIDALIGNVRQQPTAKRTLIWSPAYMETDDPLRRRWDPVERVSGTAVEDTPPQWIDIGFWIRPNGKTADIEVLRGSRGMGRMAAMTKQVAGRRYSVAPGASQNLGDYRVERWSWRPEFKVVVGHLARKRVGHAKLQILDLTERSGIVEEAG